MSHDALPLGRDAIALGLPIRKPVKRGAPISWDLLR